MKRESEMNESRLVESNEDNTFLLYLKEDYEQQNQSDNLEGKYAAEEEEKWHLLQSEESHN